LVEIGLLNIGRIFGVLELVLTAHCQPTGDLVVALSIAPCSRRGGKFTP